MTETTAVVAPRGEAEAATDDERIAYRGVFQRLFIRPEIGAMIGIIGIWVFFWAVSVPFGTANGSAGILDVAATLGIMAVAVSVLMVGGEFDLSSGANTGALAIFMILLVKETGDIGGAGLSLWIAIPVSFLVAMGIGYANGFMVERTALPSFIVTLATFFVLRGAKLGFSKLIVDQIQVGRTDEGHGYDFWRPIFAAEWDRTGHQFGARDGVFLGLILSGIALVTFAVYEMHFARRRDGLKAAALPELFVGLATTGAGVAILHLTDGTGANLLGSVVFGLGVLISLHGFASWRLEPLAKRGSISLNLEVGGLVGLGLAGIGLASVFALAFDPYDESSFFFPFTKQGFRATAFMVLLGVGFVSLMIGSYRARRINASTKSAVSLLTAIVIGALAFFVKSESQSVKFRSEAFSAILVVAMMVAVWAVLGALFEERDRVDRRADSLGARLFSVGASAVVLAFAVKLLFTTSAELDAGITPAKFSMRIVWFFGFTAVMVWVLGKTRFGSWTFAVGGNKEAARQVGVPAARTKTQLFMLVSGAAWLVGMLLAFRLNTIQAGTGDGLEFDFIIAAVVGGTLLTGGYGTALGGALGAVIVAMATLGIPFARWNSDWRFLFLGVILLLAVISNRFIRTRAEALR